jgi:hypothetical protein
MSDRERGQRIQPLPHDHPQRPFEMILTVGLGGKVKNGRHDVPLVYGGRKIGTFIEAWSRSNHGQFGRIAVDQNWAYRLDLFDIRSAILETEDAITGEDRGNRRRNFERDEEKVMEHGGDNADLGEAGEPRRAWDFMIRRTGRLLTKGSVIDERLRSITAPQENPIMPERFNSVTQPQETPIVDPALSSTSTPRLG